MAKETKKSAGSNKAKCKKYSDRMHLERNRVRRLKRHVKQVTDKNGNMNDLCAKTALEAALRVHSGR